ncbi:hypothetical protein B9Z55_004716 [Caenorhabditis nigoni]|uniref:Uncharacterized protein n=1 Tax=Caenorhabditis nigoni TaxID=1611254 RepID=A0A2G5UXQ2_9PELO|nr:hypothetical protein B9Z55_004716 [Caenorhabditis nigoni]
MGSFRWDWNKEKKKEYGEKKNKKEKKEASVTDKESAVWRKMGMDRISCFRRRRASLCDTRTCHVSDSKKKEKKKNFDLFWF